MNFCQNCGHKLDKTLKFCIECGAQIEQDYDDQKLVKNVKLQKAPPVIEEQIPTPTQKKPLSTGKKILLSLLGIIVIGLIVAHKMLLSHFNPVKTVVLMDEAVINNDVDLFMKQIDIDKKAIINEESFVSYIKDEEWYSLKDDILTYFETEANETKGFNHVIFSEYGARFLVIKPKPILFGLYNDYKFYIEPTELSLITDIDKTEVTIADKTIELDADKKKTFGLIYPGSYDIETKAANVYGDFSSTLDIIITPSDKETIEIDIDAIEYYVEADYEFGDAVVFIDGKSTDKTIDQLGILGPFPHNSKAKVHAEWKAKDDLTLKSNTVSLNDIRGEDIYLDFDLARAIQANAEHLDDEEAGALVLDFRDSYEYAVNYADFSEIKDYLEPDSHAYKDLKKYINDLEDTYYMYNFTSNLVTNVKKVDDNVIEVFTNEQFIFTNHNYESIDYDRDKKYVVVLKDGNYKIRKIDYLETKREAQ